MWHVLTSSKYTWSWKQIPEVEWDTQEETQLPEVTHRLTQICCQIPSLSPAALNYDQQCFQWFTGKLNCFMDTDLSSSAGQSTEATHSIAKWSLSDRFMSNPYCIICHSDGCKKVKKAHYWTIEPISKYEFGGGETVIKTAEAKNKITISFYGSRDRTFVIAKQSSIQVVWKGTQHTQKTIWYSEGVGKKLEMQNIEISCIAAYEQFCCLVDETLVKSKWIVKMTYLLGKYTDSRNPRNLTQTTCLRNGS